MHDLHPQKNRLFASLPDTDGQRWRQLLEPVELLAGQILRGAGGHMHHVYFPTTAIISLLCVMENGASTEVAVIGNDGLIGLPLMIGSGTTPYSAVVQSAGKGFRIKACAMQEEFFRSQFVAQLLLRYTQSLITQLCLTAACNRHHSVDQQLCRWLLVNLDRLESNEVTMTQEMIASMLGVRREGITESAFKLQKAGLIRYTRGHIQVLDRKGLEQRSCECYAVVKREQDRLLPMASVSEADVVAS
ncbi:Crp/Fnr family transcriptional regulator [Chitinimonas viridis]|uniref:Crp/Fnr family transcriptional regulator n=1 Tax=Chitinimonas viridis TaxID=664880 RepID=A0ABT8B064_9NEIS|nr:Crp/Fnr family transcriptional regulator [Chitinimonas viridis]MDN3575496.1 Crp/Fnr family transcriptional regulator [Chitinimonas viridis]